MERNLSDHLVPLYTIQGYDHIELGPPHVKSSTLFHRAIPSPLHQIQAFPMQPSPWGLSEGDLCPQQARETLCKLLPLPIKLSSSLGHFSGPRTEFSLVCPFVPRRR
jgi:hypothetical protein